jgi:hypothetical protein
MLYFTFIGGGLMLSLYLLYMKELIRRILREELNKQRVPPNYWTPDTLKQKAEEFKTAGDFIKYASSAYQTARRMGVLDYVLQNLQRTYRKKHTKDEVAKEALKYTNRHAFQKGSPSHYRAAFNHKWIDDVCKHMESPYKSWAKEDVEKEALKYNYPSEFEKNSPKAYSAAQRHGWLNDVTSHMGKLGSIKKRMVYAYEFSDNYVYIGLTYHKDKRNDQHMKSGPVYKHIQETGLIPIRIEISDYIDAQDASKLEQLTENKYRNEGWNILNQAKTGLLGGNILIWTPETVRNESQKYKTLSDFRNYSPKAYNAARRNGWLPELGLLNTQIKWDFDSVQKEAMKYKTRKEFSLNSKGAYVFALRNKILDDITKHMDVKKIKWTKELANTEALKYKTKGDFAKNSKKAYETANKHKWLDDITKHMIPKQKNQFG